jgi:predicted HTH domain antitoxin
VILLTSQGHAIIKMRKIGGGLEELIVEANASVLEGWEIDQLLKLRERQPDLLEPVVRRLVQENEDIRWSVVLGAYQDRQINLGKAAELLGLTELELRRRFVELGVPLRIGPADLAEAHAEVEAVRAWFADEAGERPS